MEISIPIYIEDGIAETRAAGKVGSEQRLLFNTQITNCAVHLGKPILPRQGSALLTQNGGGGFKNNAVGIQVGIVSHRKAGFQIYP